MNGILTVREVATRLSVCTMTIYRWLKNGKIKGRKLGWLWRVTEEDLALFIMGNGAEQREFKKNKKVPSGHCPKPTRVKEDEKHKQK